jgi:uncharacterized small protein (DUF1192 family)
MSSIGELLTLDYQIDDLRGRIAIEQERIAQAEAEGRSSTKAREGLDALERNLNGLLANRQKTIQNLERGQFPQREAS